MAAQTLAERVASVAERIEFLMGANELIVAHAEATDGPLDRAALGKRDAYADAAKMLREALA